MGEQKRNSASPRAISGAESGDQTVVLTVHGTNDADPSDAGQRWWQKGSVFAQSLVAELGQRGMARVEILPVHWSGANSDSDRLQGARTLAAAIDTLSKTQRPFAIVGHSHGGNVVMEALGRAKGADGLVGTVTFGTPFFVRRLKLVPRIIAWSQILLGVTMTPILATYLATTVAYTGSVGIDKIIGGIIFFGLLLAFCLWALVSGLRTVSRERTVRRRLRSGVDPMRWLVIHSPRDEAMRLLEAAAQLKPTFVTTAWGRRAVTRFAPLGGIIAVLAAFALTAGYFMQPIIGKIQAGKLDFGLAADFTFILLVPVVYLLASSAIWLAARLGAGWFYATAANHMISAGLVGAAYGGDASDVLVRVERAPPQLDGVMELAIEALELGGVDDKAIFESAQKVYEEALANEKAEGGFGDPDRMWKLLSDALYHNAYMRDPRVIATVAEHISKGVDGGARR
ncbi:MAG: esterase/lipase family protein [Hyphomicrobiaceae bacterium]